VPDPDFRRNTENHHLRQVDDICSKVRFPGRIAMKYRQKKKQLTIPLSYDGIWEANYFSFVNESLMVKLNTNKKTPAAFRYTARV
jgi:hypothetical protein